MKEKEEKHKHIYMYGQKYRFDQCSLDDKSKIRQSIRFESNKTRRFLTEDLMLQEKGPSEGFQ